MLPEVFAQQLRRLLSNVRIASLDRRSARRSASLWLALVGLVALSACDLTARSTFPTQIVAPPTVPTDTLAPVVSRTPRYTATLIPTATQIPTNTLPPTATIEQQLPSALPTTTPTPPTRGSVKANGSTQTANLRSGPDAKTRQLRSVRAGTALIVLGISSDREWYNVLLDDGTEGWITADLIVVANPTAVAVLSTADLTRRAEETASAPKQTAIPTLRVRGTLYTDVLAYCDLPDFRKEEGGKTFQRSTQLTVYWSWFANTPEQVRDHIDYSQYDVKLNGKPIDGWRNYRTDVIKREGKYWVYWFVSVGALAPGDYKVEYRVTWTQKIDDGEKTFGPGGAEESNTGTCAFTVK